MLRDSLLDSHSVYRAPAKVMNIISRTAVVLACLHVAGCMTREERIADGQSFMEQQEEKIDFGPAPDEQSARVAAINAFAKSGSPVSNESLGPLRKGYVRRGSEIEYGWLIQSGKRVVFFTKFGLVIEVSGKTARAI